jgi:hypothetical protein
VSVADEVFTDRASGSQTERENADKSIRHILRGWHRTRIISCCSGKPLGQTPIDHLEDLLCKRQSALRGVDYWLSQLSLGQLRSPRPKACSTKCLEAAPAISASRSYSRHQDGKASRLSRS